MNGKKAMRKFGDACMNAPEGASLTVGVTWDERKGWRVMMSVHTAVMMSALLMLNSKDARGLADMYDKQHRAPEYRGKTTGLEWLAPELRTLAAECDVKNRARVIPPEVLAAVTPANAVKA